jgi:hypothetical protein
MTTSAGKRLSSNAIFAGHHRGTRYHVHRLVGRKPRGLAIDLGCGSGRDTPPVFAIIVASFGLDRSQTLSTRDTVPTFGDGSELGFAMVPSAHGKGFATEAARAALRRGDLAWGGCETVCMIGAENIPSLESQLS